MRLKTRYTQRLPVAPGLRLDIPFFEGSGTKVLDVSGKGNHGTITDAVWTRDENGVAMSFNGTSAYIDCGNDASLSITSNATWEFWMKQTSYSYMGGFIDKNTTKEFGINTRGTNRISIQSGDGVDRDNIDFLTTIDNNVWYHIAITRDASLKKYYGYKNGVMIGAGQSYIYTPVTSTQKVPIGARNEGASGYFNGTIDEVRIYAVALTASQIKRRYEQTKRDYVRAS